MEPDDEYAKQVKQELCQPQRNRLILSVWTTFAWKQECGIAPLKRGFSRQRFRAGQRRRLSGKHSSIAGQARLALQSRSIRWRGDRSPDANRNPVGAGDSPQTDKGIQQPGRRLPKK